MRRLGVLLVALLWAAKPALADWEVHPAEFEFSATLTAILIVDGAATAGADISLGAFAGDECRGVATPINVLDNWVFFMTLYANVAGEAIRFRALIPADGGVLDVGEEIVFAPNAVYGEPVFPFELHVTSEEQRPPVITAITTAGAEVPPGFLLRHGYPNPFNSATLIGYHLPTDGRVEVTVYDLRGKRVRTLVSEWRPAGRGYATWDGRDSRGRAVASGTYFCAMESRRFRAMRKLLLLK